MPVFFLESHLSTVTLGTSGSLGTREKRQVGAIILTNSSSPVTGLRLVPRRLPTPHTSHSFGALFYARQILGLFRTLLTGLLACVFQAQMPP